MTPQSYKQELLNKLYEPYKKCIQCPLGTMGRKNVVFGQGNADATIMFIGEGPGQEEDNQGLPFVGRSGKLLNKILEALNTSREEVFITNIVKCRPPNNRKPTPIESQICKKLLLINQIRIIRPAIICTLGSAAIQGLLSNYDLKISGIRGSLLSFEGTPVLPTYHPAYILRNPKELPTLYKDIEHAISLSTSLKKNC